ncbi:MAG: TIGR00730 family Rossman fold protein [Bordetella sp.]
MNKPNDPRESLWAVCVFCGSRLGHDPHWTAMATETGRSIANRSWRVVYGAGRWGLMGTVAQAALESGAHVTGIIPDYLTKIEPVLLGLDRLEIVETMIERKVRMMALSDSFLVLPGGIGTLEELFEVWTGLQTHAHTKPLVLVNLKGYYDPLLGFIQKATDEGFLSPSQKDRLVVTTSVHEAVERLEAFASDKARAGAAER